MNMPNVEDARTVMALLTSVAATSFWVAGLIEAVIGDALRSALHRGAASATAFASAVMLAQIAYVFSYTTCSL